METSPYDIIYRDGRYLARCYPDQVWECHTLAGARLVLAVCGDVHGWQQVAGHRWMPRQRQPELGEG